jgi:hypothetical protein
VTAAGTPPTVQTANKGRRRAICVLAVVAVTLHGPPVSRAGAARLTAASHSGPAELAALPLDDAQGEGVTLRADAVTLQGLQCPLLPPALGQQRTCRAQSASLEHARLTQEHGAGRVLCLTSPSITLTDIHFRTAALTGTLPGGLRLSLPTDAVPPLPFPSLTLVDVEAQNVQLAVARGSTERMNLELTSEARCNRVDRSGW